MQVKFIVVAGDIAVAGQRRLGEADHLRLDEAAEENFPPAASTFQCTEKSARPSLLLRFGSHLLVVLERRHHFLCVLANRHVCRVIALAHIE